MLPKRVFNISGISFILIGIILLLNSIVFITGNAIIEDVGTGIGSFWALWFIVGGIALLIESRNSQSSKLEIFISRTAIERSENDPKVKASIGQYMQEVAMIAADPTHRPQERIEGFQVSPRGNKGLRVAWRYSKSEGRLYIDDFLYHEGKDYNGKWIRKVRGGKITPRDYQTAGYQVLAK